MNQVKQRWLRTSVAVCLAGILTVALFCSSLLAAKEETKRVLTITPAPAGAASSSGMNVLKLGKGDGLPWIDLASIISDVKGEIKVTGTIPLPEDFPKAASLEEGSIIRTFQNKPVTTAADMIAQYDKLKAGDTVVLSFELKEQTGAIKFVKPKSTGNCIMIKK